MGGLRSLEPIYRRSCLVVDLCEITIYYLLINRQLGRIFDIGSVLTRVKRFAKSFFLIIKSIFRQKIKYLILKTKTIPFGNSNLKIMKNIHFSFIPDTRIMKNYIRCQLFGKNSSIKPHFLYFDCISRLYLLFKFNV